MFLWFFIFSFSFCRGEEEPGYMEENLIEQSIVDLYGTIILREDVGNIVVYICCRYGFIIHIHLHKENNTMQIFKKTNYTKKSIKRPHLHFSSGITELRLGTLKKQFNCLIELPEIRKLVEDWDMAAYKYALELMSKYINQIW